MINLENIGIQIKHLRKQKKVSQERMAEDLGMYQADISNLEHAKKGSGITDLYKLEDIAEYLGVSLIELLTSNGTSLQANHETTQEEGQGMKDYTITNVQYGTSGNAYVSELTLASPDGREMYITFLEADDEPRFFETKESIYERILRHAEAADKRKGLNKYCILSGEDYIDIFTEIEPKWVDVVRYLIYVGTEDETDVKKYIKSTKGKMLSEIMVPVPSREPEDIIDVNFSDLGIVYRYRLMVEASIKNPSVFSDFDNTLKREKAILKKLKDACKSDDTYKVWKKHIVVCTYVMGGIGQYDEIMSEEQVESFKYWITHTASGVYCGFRDATKKEIRSYVALHIADNLLDLQETA